MAGCKLFFIDVGDSPGTYLPEVWVWMFIYSAPFL